MSAPQYSLELHVKQVRLEVNELEAYAERRHRQHVVTYEEAAALGLANVEERAERNHLEAISELQAALANSEFKAATREKALIAEMSLAQAHSVNEDNRLREELAELHQKSVSDALDLQLEGSRYAQNLQEQANQHVQNSQESHVGAIPSTFSDLQGQTKGRARSSSQRAQGAERRPSGSFGFCGEGFREGFGAG